MEPAQYHHLHCLPLDASKSLSGFSEFPLMKANTFPFLDKTWGKLEGDEQAVETPGRNGNRPKRVLRPCQVVLNQNGIP